MKEINSQLTDAMIIALADSYNMGVNFSDSVEIAKIGEGAIVEANEYWSLLSKQEDFITQILPETSIVDSLFSQMNTFVPEAVVKESTPSPYMKYVMVFAAPLSILVMILGISFRQQPTPQNNTLAEIKPLVASNIAVPTPETSITTTASSKTNVMVARMSKTVATPEDISKSDPKKLFAMLSEAGSQEAQPETIIDEAYEAQLTELDSKVIGTDNSTTYAPL